MLAAPAAFMSALMTPLAAVALAALIDLPIAGLVAVGGTLLTVATAWSPLAALRAITLAA
jgi:hypothetical protein